MYCLDDFIWIWERGRQKKSVSLDFSISSNWLYEWMMCVTKWHDFKTPVICRTSVLMSHMLIKAILFTINQMMMMINASEWLLSLYACCCYIQFFLAKCDKERNIDGSLAYSFTFFLHRKRLSVWPMPTNYGHINILRNDVASIYYTSVDMHVNIQHGFISAY